MGEVLTIAGKDVGSFHLARNLKWLDLVLYEGYESLMKLCSIRNSKLKVDGEYVSLDYLKKHYLDQTQAIFMTPGDWMGREARIRKEDGTYAELENKHEYEEKEIKDKKLEKLLWNTHVFSVHH